MAERFLQAAAVRFDAPPKRFGKAALERLQNHDWSGNVRELENLCWRRAALAPGDTIKPADLDGMLAASRPAPAREWDDEIGRATSELEALMRSSDAVCCLKKKQTHQVN